MKIREHMPVVCSKGRQFATVDRVEGSSIKLTKDQLGKHHYIPLEWVTAVDQQVHIDRPGDQAMREWTEQPTGAQGMRSGMAGGGQTGSGLQDFGGQPRSKPDRGRRTGRSGGSSGAER